MAWMDTQLVDKPEFNMAVLFLTRLDKRLGEADEASQTSDYIKWYRVLRSIYRNVHFKIKEKGNEDEERLLNESFAKAEKFLKADQTTNRSVNAQIQAIAITNIELILDEVNLRLNDLLYEYGLVFPKSKEEKDVEDLLDESMNI
jgi:hypothetical protein